MGGIGDVGRVCNPLDFHLGLEVDDDFADVGLVHGTAAAKFGDLRLCGLTTTPDLNGQTVRDALVTLNTALAGTPITDTIPDLDVFARELGGAFFNGTPSTFAQDHSIVGTCP